MIDGTTGAPGKPVNITIGNATYSLKFSALAEYVIGDLKFDMRTFAANLRERNAAVFSDFLKVFSAMVAHNFVQLGQPVPKPEHWALLIGDDSDKVKEVCEAVGQVLQEKTKASAVRLQEPAPKEEQKPAVQ
jgi:hypothetical protein